MGRAREIYQKHFAWFDLAGTLLLYALLVYAVWRSKMIGIEWTLPEARSFFSALASVAGSMLAFTITGITVISGLLSQPRLAMLSSNPQVGNLYKVFFSASRWLAATTLWALIGMVFRIKMFESYYLIALGALVLVSIVRLWRVIWVLAILAEGLTPAGNDLPPEPDRTKPPRPNTKPYV